MLVADALFYKRVENSMVYKILNAFSSVLPINIRVTSNGSDRFFNSCAGVFFKDSNNSLRTGKSKRS